MVGVLEKGAVEVGGVVGVGELGWWWRFGELGGGGSDVDGSTRVDGAEERGGNFWRSYSGAGGDGGGMHQGVWARRPWRRQVLELTESLANIEIFDHRRYLHRHHCHQEQVMIKMMTIMMKTTMQMMMMKMRR